MCIRDRGYIVRTAPYAVVVGGVNMDIGGTPMAPLVRQDSNPGRVRMSLGGVGRNIAHNMALLGLDVRMITALGDDVYAQKITTSCIELGIDLAHSLQVPGASTSTYLFLTDEKGDMELAVSDMEIYDHLTPQFLAGKEPLLNLSLIHIYPVYALIAIATSIAVFLPAVRSRLERGSRLYDVVMLLMDSIGLGVFTVVGVQSAYSVSSSYSIFLLAFVGVITGVGGGVLLSLIHIWIWAVSGAPRRRRRISSPSIPGSMMSRM